MKLGPMDSFCEVLTSLRQMVVAMWVLVTSFEMPHLMSSILERVKQTGEEDQSLPET